VTELPTSEDIQKLTPRAIVAYAVRCARRAAIQLRGSVEDEIIEAPLRIAERLASAVELDQTAGVATPRAAARVARAMGTLREPSTVLAALCLTRAADVAMHILRAIAQPSSKRGRIQAVRAARAAAELSRWAASAADEPESTARVESARRDYEFLWKHFGREREVVLGEPIDLSSEWWRREPN
jgi:hypothetical protein